MERALGIGGVFFRADDPGALARWYRAALGVDANDEAEDRVWWQAAGPTVWAPFPRDTSYFGGPEQQVMLNLRVADLEAILAQAAAHGAVIAPEREHMEGIGTFGWITDPEGNRVELWQAAPEAMVQPAPESA